MIGTVSELVQYLQQTLPQPKSIKNLKPDERAGYVTFHWNGRDFVVKKSLEVFEMKNDKLFITGASILMQTALMKRNRNEKVIETVIDTLAQAEDLLSAKHQVENGLKLIAAVKGTLGKLAGK